MLVLVPCWAEAQIDWVKVEAEAVERLQEYCRIDTSNPPGNEAKAAEFFCGLFRREGIECNLYEIAPGRANAIARLRGNGKKRPMVLLNHTDVVTSDAKAWSVPPFSGVLREGAVYGARRAGHEVRGDAPRDGDAAAEAAAGAA